MVGSSPKTSSPTSASCMALRMPGPGLVTVSLRRSMISAMMATHDKREREAVREDREAPGEGDARGEDRVELRRRDSAPRLGHALRAGDRRRREYRHAGAVRAVSDRRTLRAQLAGRVAPDDQARRPLAGESQEPARGDEEDRQRSWRKAAEDARGAEPAARRRLEDRWRGRKPRIRYARVSGRYARRPRRAPARPDAARGSGQSGKGSLETVAARSLGPGASIVDLARPAHLRVAQASLLALRGSQPVPAPWRQGERL